MSDPPARLLASVDIGSNSVRLLLAEVRANGEVYTHLRRGAVTRLGEGLGSTGQINEAAWRRTLDTVRHFVEDAEYNGAQAVLITGTSAMRTASNGQEMAADIARHVGYPVRILTGEEEARLVFLAVGADSHGPRIVMDLGGGSTEVILGSTASEVLCARSIPYGAVNLTERFLVGDSPSHEQRVELEAFLHKEFLQGLDGMHFGTGRRLFGVGGTLTALAAADMQLLRYDPTLIEGHEMSRSRVEALADMLWRTPLHARRHIPGVSSGRADIILAGVSTVLTVMNIIDAPSIFSSNRGLRYGILLEALSPGHDT
jgi:exopolyphosphatase/guanosine-5'-triphosphate,3'-diphosphate pyrophosphatase